MDRMPFTLRNRPILSAVIIYVASILLVLVVGTSRAEAQPASTDHGSGTAVECQRYGCVYGHDRCHWTRDGRSCTTAYGIARDRLPDGPDGRYFVKVKWPVIRSGTSYMPSRRVDWDRLAKCESGWDWDINTGNGYHGGLQFSPATWRAYGGSEFAGQAYAATPEQQIVVAERVLWAGWRGQGPQGRGAWPGCLRKGQGAPRPVG